MARKLNAVGRPTRKERQYAKEAFFSKTRGIKTGTSKYVEHTKFFGVKKSLIEGISVMTTEELGDFVEYERSYQLLEDIVDGLCYQTPNAHAYIEKLKELLYRAGQMICVDKKIIDGYDLEAKRLSDKYAQRSRKRWTETEDLMLVEMATHDNMTMMTLSQEFGRTPSAIASRLSYLVGIEKLSSKVAGRFIGTIDGKQAEVEINGVVSKR